MRTWMSRLAETYGAKSSRMSIPRGIVSQWQVLLATVHKLLDLILRQQGSSVREDDDLELEWKRSETFWCQNSSDMNVNTSPTRFLTNRI